MHFKRLAYALLVDAKKKHNNKLKKMENITPKEKAFELVNRMILTYEDTSDYVYESTAKKCALIAVAEIVKNRLYWKEDYEYWKNVEIEINKL